MMQRDPHPASPLTRRKHNRLDNYDYSTPGAYFITICTIGRQCCLCSAEPAPDDVGASFVRPVSFPLTPWGQIVSEEIIRWDAVYPCVHIDKYVVMPNHIHLIVRIDDAADGRAQLAPTPPNVSTMVQSFKGAVTKRIGSSIWQKSFFDHIIRGPSDYRELRQYIDQNPQKWRLDRFHPDNDK